MAETKEIQIKAKDRKYFNSTKNYTLSLLGSFDGIEYYIPEYQNEKYKYDKVYTVPITFGNYEKSIQLEDLNISEKELKQQNYNFIPRLVLSFEGMVKNASRQTQKYQRFFTRVKHPIDNNTVLDIAYNSLAYDFNYTLLLQTRGMTQATQITEQILTQFNPSYNLNLIEFPLFSEMTQTQILIQDPEFDIVQEFEDTGVNIINVTFGITVRGNLYSQISFQSPIETIDMFTHIWEGISREQSNLASYYKFDVSPETHEIYIQTERHYDGTKKYDYSVKLPYDKMILLRPDFNPPEISTLVGTYYQNRFFINHLKRKENE